jgi:subtilisin family serine protease
LLLSGAAAATAGSTDPHRDILVTFANIGAESAKLGASPPYRFGKRYGISAAVRRLSRAIEQEYGLATVDHWPIQSLSVYCYVYRVPAGEDRDNVLARLNSDGRVESAQSLQQFQTHLDELRRYNDPYLNLQHGLMSLGVIEAHRATQGEGVRVAVIDSHVDVQHEDLRGRIRSFKVFSDQSKPADAEHGTAVASVIGANANNAVGIVGVAPEAMLDILVSCWSEASSTVCDSFTLAKALDSLVSDPPQVVNLSLAGPDDRLVGRLIEKVQEAGVVVVAANPAREDAGFPASMPGVVAVGLAEQSSTAYLHAPGEQILVALPDDQYELRSGSSLSAAHASGVIALLLAVMPQESPAVLRDILRQSQAAGATRAIDACAALQLAGAKGCEPTRAVRTE